MNLEPIIQSEVSQKEKDEYCNSFFPSSSSSFLALSCAFEIITNGLLRAGLACHNPQGDQSWVFFGRTDAEAETPILWAPHANSWLIGKDPDAGRDWGQEEKGMTADEMAGWHHWLDEWVWVNSGSWWWEGRPGVLRFMGSQRVRQHWETEFNWTEIPRFN